MDGRDWLSNEPWRFKAADDTDFDEDVINHIRGQVIAPLWRATLSAKRRIKQSAYAWQAVEAVRRRLGGNARTSTIAQQPDEQRHEAV